MKTQVFFYLHFQQLFTYLPQKKKILALTLHLIDWRHDTWIWMKLNKFTKTVTWSKGTPVTSCLLLCFWYQHNTDLTFFSDKMTDLAASNLFESQTIFADHKDLIHDVAYDFYGERMATCSSDQYVKVGILPVYLLFTILLVERCLRFCINSTDPMCL